MNLCVGIWDKVQVQLTVSVKYDLAAVGFVSTLNIFGSASKASLGKDMVESSNEKV
jgi:hypothetical protein